MVKYKQKGFTLIELLVVISIIGLLSTVAMTSLNGARYKTKVSEVKVDMNNLTQAVIVSQQEQNLYLMNITNSACSRCVGCSGKDLRNIAVSDSCYVTWANALNRIQSATGNVISGMDAILRDPWGSPYLLDENEGERPLDLCVSDNIRSVGPDGYFGTTDDIIFYLPFARCP